MENVISVFRMLMVFSIKLTPDISAGGSECTKRLNVILVKSTLDVFDHETRLSDCRVSYHSYFDDDTTARGKQVSQALITTNTTYTPYHTNDRGTFG